MYDMLLFAVTYREALEMITGDWDMKLRQYEMDDEEWEIAHQLCQVLKVSSHILILVSFFPSLCLDFQRCNTFFSCDGTPNIATVIPAMDCIDEVLATDTLDTQYCLAVQAVFTMGKKTLNCYYSKTNLSEVYELSV
jgi:hypothetical protein